MAESQVTKEELVSVKDTILAKPLNLIGQWGQGWNREIEFTPLGGQYVVWDHGKVIHETLFADSALYAYYNHTRRV